jgi:hypothetical protein
VVPHSKMDKSDLTDISYQWDTLKRNIKSDYELDNNQIQMNYIIDSIFPTIERTQLKKEDKVQVHLKEMQVALNGVGLVHRI